LTAASRDTEQTCAAGYRSLRARTAAAAAIKPQDDPDIVPALPPCEQRRSLVVGEVLARELAVCGLVDRDGNADDAHGARRGD
jgi:hypothetical protein